jgi:acyl carrier protein
MAMTTNDRDRIRAEVSTLLAAKGDIRPFADDEALLLGARLDSMDVVQLVAFVEKAFRLDFGAVDFDPATFESVDSLASFIAGQAGTAPGTS